MFLKTITTAAALIASLGGSTFAQTVCTLTSSSSSAVSAAVSGCNGGGIIKIGDLKVDGNLVLSGLKNVTVSITGNVEFPIIPQAGIKYKSLWTKDKYLLDISGSDVTIDGNNTGVLYGQGSYYWNLNWKYDHKPKFTRFKVTGTNVVKNLKWRDSPSWTITVADSTNLRIDNINITSLNPPDHGNTDGVNIARSTNVYFGNSYVENGDDCATATNGSINVVFENLYCKGGHGVSIGSLGSGNSTATVDNVTIRNIEMVDHQNGFRIKTWPNGKGYCRNVTVENFSTEDTWNPLTFRQDYCDRNTAQCVSDDQGLDHSPQFSSQNVILQNIYVRNMTMNGAPVYWRSVEAKFGPGGYENITLVDINLPGAAQCQNFNNSICSKNATADEPTEFVPFPVWLGSSV